MISRIFARRFASAASGQSGGIVPNNARYKKIQEMQNIFCRDDGLLVWQKMASDKLLYVATMALTILGFVPVLQVIGKMSFPAKKPE